MLCSMPYALNLPPKDPALAELTMERLLDRSWSEEVAETPVCELGDGRKGCGLQPSSIVRFRIKHDKMPAFLGLQLRRGENDGYHKDDRLVTVGATLNLSRFLDDPTKPATYELVGVVLHRGMHYTTLAFDDVQCRCGTSSTTPLMRGCSFLTRY